MEIAGTAITSLARDRGLRMRKWWITLLGCAAAVGVASGQVGDVAVAEPPPDWVGGEAALARLGRRLPAVAARERAVGDRAPFDLAE